MNHCAKQDQLAYHVISYFLGLSNQVKTATIFSPYQLVHGVESILLVECEIPSFKLAVEILLETSALEERLVHLEKIHE